MKAKEYEAIVEDCRKSGMTILEYSERIGVSVHTLHTWIRRTRKRQGVRDDRKTYGEYRAIVMECKRSGEPAKTWCEEKGIRYTTYCGWAKKVYRKEGRENVEKMCGVERIPRVRQPEPKVTANPTLCEMRR